VLPELNCQSSFKSDYGSRDGIMMERQIWRIDNKEAVVCGGYAHWLFASESNQFHVLNVDLQTGRLSLTKLLSPTEDWIIKVTSMETYEAEQAHNHRIVDGLTGANRLLTTANGTHAYRSARTATAV
jgi:hypothetical protein